MIKDPFMRKVRPIAWAASLFAGLSMAGSCLAAEMSSATADQLKVSENRRFLVHARTGKPFFMLADTAWNLGALKLEEVDLYLDSRVAHGFNTIMFALNFHPQADEANAYGNVAYIGQDKTEINPAYFEYCDAIVRKCGDRKLRVMLFAMWAGEKAGTMNGYTAEGLTRLGRALGTRYRGIGNVIFARVARPLRTTLRLAG